MKQKNMVSIIVPVYNVEKYIKKCIDSIINQTYQNLEIILVDDGSPDKCGEICEEYSKKDNRIKVIHKENGGVSDARNAGLEKATGEYIAFIDPDDYIQENTIDVLVGMIEENNLDIAHIGLKRFNNEEMLKEEEFFKNKTKIFSQYEICTKMLKTEIITRVCGILAKRELFKDIQFPVNRYFEDLATYYKILLKSNRVAINDAKLYNYRLTNNSITMSYSPKKCKDFILSTNEMINEITNKYKELNELANIVKIYNYVDAITMINKKEDIELYSEINKYLKSQKKFIKANYKFFNKKVKMKIKLYFFNIHFLKFCMNIYRNKRKYL